jgi:hypothetical protein
VSSSNSTYERTKDVLVDEFADAQSKFIDSIPEEALCNCTALMILLRAKDTDEATELMHELIEKTLELQTQSHFDPRTDGPDEYFTLALRDVFVTGLLMGRAVEQSA